MVLMLLKIVVITIIIAGNQNTSLQNRVGMSQGVIFSSN